MKRLQRRGALVLCVAFLTLVAVPASAQEARYAGVPAPAAGAALAGSGERGTIAPTAAVQGQVLPLQVSGGGVSAARQGNASGLAFTGSDIVTMVLMGVSAMAVGFALTRRARLRTTSVD